MAVRILIGDCREKLAELADESVHCVVTSPPYWGLRDYGTAQWDGGDAECDHKPDRKPRRFTNGRGEGADDEYAGSNLTSWTTRDGTPTNPCPKCGARRIDSQLGLEPTISEHVAAMVAVFREVRRVLRKDGTLWLNYGDSYAGSWGNQGRKEDRGTQRPINGGMITPVLDGRYPDKGHNTGATTDGLKPKDLCGIPWRVAFALQADGWWLRQDIIWSKPNPMPESVTDRCTKAHEYLFLLTKSERYYYDAEAIKEPATADRPDVAENGLLRTGAAYLNGNIDNSRKPKGRASGNKTHKGVTEYETSDSEEHRTKAGLLKISENAYPTRNKRSVWEIATAPFSAAHFATFPPALIEPCIKAGTSEKGCCAKCGAPWVREVERETVRTHAPTREMAKTPLNVVRAGWREGGPKSKTLGWSPSCSCNAEVVPATCLDPFGGAGTTGLVADRLQRNAVLIELNPEYAAMAERRISGDAPLFADLTREAAE